MNDFEIKSDRPNPPVVRVTIGVIIDCGRVLLGRRGAGSTFAGCWEFPGGKVEADESIEAALLRELREELGVECEIVAPLEPFEYDTGGKRLRLFPFRVRITQGTPTPIVATELKWVAAADLPSHQFPPANTAFVESLSRSTDLNAR